MLRVSRAVAGVSKDLREVLRPSDMPDAKKTLKTPICISIKSEQERSRNGRTPSTLFPRM